MAAISTIYDDLISRIETLLPGHTRLPNPYEIEQNNDQFLNIGWGITVNPGGNNTERFVSKQRSLLINFKVDITRKYFSREFDADAKTTTEKLLLEDFQLLIDDSHKNNFNINGAITTVIGFTGIVPIKTDANRFLDLISDITVEYFVKT